MEEHALFLRNIPVLVKTEQEEEEGAKSRKLCCRSVTSDSLWPHGLQHARLPYPSPSRSLLGGKPFFNCNCLQHKVKVLSSLVDTSLSSLLVHLLLLGTKWFNVQSTHFIYYLLISLSGPQGFCTSMDQWRSIHSSPASDGEESYGKVKSKANR